MRSNQAVALHIEDNLQAWYRDGVKVVYKNDNFYRKRGGGKYLLTTKDNLAIVHDLKIKNNSA